MFSDQFFIDWHSGKKKLDKNNILSDRKAEKEFKPLMTEFVSWLSSTDYGEEEYDEEAPAEDEESKEAPKEKQSAQS